jgi:hypothetical protein
MPVHTTLPTVVKCRAGRADFAGAIDGNEHFAGRNQDGGENFCPVKAAGGF